MWLKGNHFLIHGNYSLEISKEFRLSSSLCGYIPAMSFSGGRIAVIYSSLIVLLIISGLHIWVFSENKAEAIRILQETPMEEVEGETKTVESARNQTEIFREYFNARLSDLNATENGTFIDSKRRIPSCPDPLHNK